MAAKLRVPRPRWHRQEIVLSLLVLVCLASPAFASDAVIVTVKNTTGIAASDLHVAFAGASGNIFVSPASVFAPGCTAPAVPSNPPVVTSTADLEWSSTCVAPGTTVSFLARTTAGPLTVAGAVWTTTGGVVIGPAVPLITHLPPPPDLGPFWAFKFASVCVGGERTYSITLQGHDQCCIHCDRAARMWTTQTFLCVFPTQLLRFLEKGKWIPVGPPVVNTSPATSVDYWFSLWFGILPPIPGLCRSFGPEKASQEMMPVGPPPTGFGDPRFALYDPAAFGLDPRYSDDTGNTFRQSADFTSTFGAFADELMLVSTSNSSVPPPPFTYPRMGQRYLSAAFTLGPLINELDRVRSAEPNPVLDALRQNLVSFGTATNAVGNELLTGSVTDPSPFFLMASALGGMSGEVQQLNPSPRFANAARELGTAATASQRAGQLVQAGLPDTGSVAMFAYALHTAIPEFLRTFSAAMAPHVVMDVNPCGFAWYPSSGDGAFATITTVVGTDAVAAVDSLPLSVSDEGSVYIPAMNYTEGQALRIHLKLPSFLSVQADVNQFTDGLDIGPVPLVAGDANNDDCIDSADLQQVTADLGKGGYGATQRPPMSDVNGDGIVDNLDLTLVQQRLGLCGPTTTGVAPIPLPRVASLAAFPNPFGGNATVRFELPRAASVTLRVYDLRGRASSVLISEQPYPAGRHSLNLLAFRLVPGVYFVRMEAREADGRTVDRVAKMTLVR